MWFRLVNLLQTIYAQLKYVIKIIVVTMPHASLLSSFSFHFSNTSANNAKAICPNKQSHVQLRLLIIHHHQCNILTNQFSNNINTDVIRGN